MTSKNLESKNLTNEIVDVEKLRRKFNNVDQASLINKFKKLEKQRLKQLERQRREYEKEIREERRQHQQEMIRLKRIQRQQIRQLEQQTRKRQRQRELEKQRKQDRKKLEKEIHKDTRNGLYIVRFDEKNEYIKYTGLNAAGTFTEIVERKTKEFYEEFKESKPMIVTPKVNNAMETATKCYVYDELLVPGDKKLCGVRDHCH